MTSVLSAMMLATTAPAFDIYCSFQTITRTDTEILGTKNGVVRYSINLSAKKWCRDKCPRSFPIRRIEGSTVYLTDGAKPPFEYVVSFDRATQDYTDILEVHGRRHIVASGAGTCRVAGFSGLAQK